ncbi:hypothetical protein DP116_05615 [Brasilonema bromeliae SPC951]|uniref:Secreted protein n=1 Tax=Brasilonema bromeliae SPC951 TaxID=385972 RepID=A0ABX1P3N5_9CYAN|nr:hypothetical protein [Brasilonema bromeliae SPC951]
MDILLLTLINVAVCFAFPKVIFMILATVTGQNQLLQTTSTSQKKVIELTSFPYCTSYTLTKRPFCKFAPSFCDRCSPG